MLRDLLDCAVVEDIAGLGAARLGDPPATLPVGTPGLAGRWVTVALDDGTRLAWPARDGAPLAATRHAGGPAWHLPADGAPYPVTADRVLGLLVTGHEHRDDVAADLRTAVEHAHVTLAGRDRLAADAIVPRPGHALLPGERLAATRNRPFHPTARAAVGWSARDLDRWGPTGGQPVTAAWVLVRRDHLRLGPGAASSSLHRVLAPELDHPDDFQPLPVHPGDHARVLPAAFAAEIDTGVVVPLDVRAGTLHPTASLRTLAVAGTDGRHLKLPLGVATLGATRLLPPRYLDNADRARRTLDAVLAADPGLAARVALCDEGTWAGFTDGTDEFAERPGRLAAQVRTYPDLGPLPLPLAALAAHEWGVLGPVLGVDGVADARRFVADLARGVLGVAVGFLRHGVLPEMHGQNVVCCFTGDGRLGRLVLRDHDTVRVHRPWLDVPEPGYRIAPGASQSLRLDTGAELVAYLQTLVVQVALRGVLDALGRHLGVDEPAWWPMVGDVLDEVLDDDRELRAILLDAATWPARSVLGPLLARGASGGVSMPAGTVRVPNPVRSAGS